MCLLIDCLVGCWQCLVALCLLGFLLGTKPSSYAIQRSNYQVLWGYSNTESYCILVINIALITLIFNQETGEWDKESI